MKRLLLLLWVSLSFTALQARAGTPVADSLLTERSIRSLYVQYPDSALRLLDVAEQRQPSGLQPFRIDMLRAMCCEIKGEFAAKERYCRRALQHDSVRYVPRRKLTVDAMLAAALASQNKYEEGIAVCREAIDLARQSNKKTIEARMSFIMGSMYVGMKAVKEGVECFEAAVALLKDTEYVREMSELSTIYGEYMTVLMDLGRPEEAIETGHAREAVIRRMSELPGPPPGYIDQQYGFLYAKMALLLHEAGQKEAAADVYRKFSDTRFSRTPTGRYFSVPYLLDSGRYREVLEQNGAYTRAFAGDTVSYNWLTALNYYARAYRGLGKYNLADAYMQRMNVLQDSIYAREAQGRAQEYAALFRLNEKELQLLEANALSKQRSLMLRWTFVAAFLLVLLVVTISVNYHKIRIRNRIASKQIDELLAQREELRRVFAQKELPEEAAKENAATTEAAEGAEAQAADKEATGIGPDDGYAAFMRMENLIVREKLFLQPSFGRDELLRVANVNKNDIGWLLRTYGKVDNINDYLNRFRVEYSVKLMRQKPNLSIEAIAEEANFRSRSTYYRAFFKVFGITPAQYMKSV